MSVKRIQVIHAFLSRGCPVLWIKPDKIWAERARKMCGMNNNKGPFIDPEAKGILFKIKNRLWYSKHSARYFGSKFYYSAFCYYAFYLSSGICEL